MMTANNYTEDQLVGQSTIGLFAALGRQTVSAMEETFGPGGTLRREIKGEDVLVDCLRSALSALNRGMPAEAMQTAIDELPRDRSMSFAAANREIDRLFEDGILVSIPDREYGGQKTERLSVVDGAQPEQNDFLPVNQFSVVGIAVFCKRISTDASSYGAKWLYISYFEDYESGAIEQFQVQYSGISNLMCTECIAKTDLFVSPESLRSTFRERAVRFFADVVARGPQVINLRRTRATSLPQQLSGPIDLETMPA